MTTQLINYDAARYALQMACSVDEVKDIRDKAEAMAAYARQAKDTALLAWATEIKVRAERRAGQMLAEMPKATGAKGSGSNQYQVRSYDTTAPQTTLSDLDITKDESSRWQKLAAVSEEKFESAVAAAKDVAGEVTTASMLRATSGKPHVSNNSGENEWYTPQVIIEAARFVMDGIDTDPASSEIANRTVGATQIFTAADDGRSRKWAGKVWMNPPYLQPLIDDFAEAVAAKYGSGEIEQACILVNNATETKWFQRLLEKADAVCFPRFRIKFLDPEGDCSGVPLQGQAILYMGTGPSLERFKNEFGKFGCVLPTAWGRDRP